MNKQLSACLLLALSPSVFAKGFVINYYGVHEEQTNVQETQPETQPATQTTGGQKPKPTLIIQDSNETKQVVQQSSNNYAWTQVGRLNDSYHYDVRKVVEGSAYAQQASQPKIANVSFTPSSNGVSVPSLNGNRNSYDQIIRSAAQKYGIDTGLIKAVMHTESGFNLKARSPVGAQGLMQLMPATARRFNVNDAYDPAQNIDGGARYLSWLIKRFNGDVRLALAGYNAGEGNVDKYNGIPPFRETQNYVQRVLTRYNSLYKYSL